MAKTYYSIRYIRTDGLNKSGDRLLNNSKELFIGQTDSCTVRLPNATQYEDEVLAVIVANDDCVSWRLVRLSPHHEIMVNGESLHYVARLSDGARINFPGQRSELVFNVNHDEAYTVNGIPVAIGRTTSKWIIGLCLLLPFLLCSVLFAYFHYTSASEKMTYEMEREARQNVFMIRVDSVLLMHVSGADTLVEDVFCYDDACGSMVAGTAFLTTDSMLVTARHCIEPWLGDPMVGLVPRDSLLIPSQWAILAEMDTSSIVVTRSSLWEDDGGGRQYLCNLRSEDFSIDKSRDDIKEFGDYYDEYVWRSISPSYNRRDMMLGDVAFTKANAVVVANRTLTINLATDEQVRELLDHKHVGKPLKFLGFPSNSQEVKLESADDQLRQPLMFDEEGKALMDIAHNGDLGHGFSGGPVLTRCKQRYPGHQSWCCVGVVSVTDFDNTKRHFSVPVTAISRNKASVSPQNVQE